MKIKNSQQLASLEDHVKKFVKSLKHIILSQLINKINITHEKTYDVKKKPQMRNTASTI